MSITLELTPQEEELLTKAATQQGLSLREYAKTQLFEAINAVPMPVDPLWDQWATAGHAATDAARMDLRAHGISAVYRRDGVIVEESPTGEVRPVGAGQ